MMVKDSGYFKNGYQKDDLNGGRFNDLPAEAGRLLWA
jgi:hypothetical protein